MIKEEGAVVAYDVCMKLKDSGVLVSGILKAHLLNEYDRLDAEMSITKRDAAFQRKRKVREMSSKHCYWEAAALCCAYQVTCTG